MSEALPGGRCRLELLVALFDRALVTGAGGQVAQAAHLAAVVKVPGPRRQHGAEQPLEVVLLVAREGTQGLLKDRAAGRSDLGRGRLPGFSERNGCGAGIRIASVTPDEAAFVEPVKQPDHGGMSQLQPPGRRRGPPWRDPPSRDPPR
jgi:hypothetical protein